MEEIVIRYWLEFVLTGVSGTLVFVCKQIYTKFKKKVDEIDTVSEGMRCLLRDNIIHAYNKYNDDLEYAPIYVKTSVEESYNAYHALGGNGVITELYNKIMALPTEPKQSK